MTEIQNKLLITVLSRLENAGVLKDMVLVGSWCTLFYQDYFGMANYRPLLKTRDIDLLVPRPKELSVEVDVAELLENLGFVVNHKHPEGYIRLMHPELILELLVPSGRHTPEDRPVDIPSLKMNAQSMKFMDFLSSNLMCLTYGSIKMKVPHPIYFALHKLLIIERRKEKEKADKDKAAAVQILNTLISHGYAVEVYGVFDKLPKKWKNTIKRQLTELLDDTILNVLESGKVGG